MRDKFNFPAADVYCFLLVQLLPARPGEDDDSFLISLDAAKVVTGQVGPRPGPQVLMANTG